MQKPDLDARASTAPAGFRSLSQEEIALIAGGTYLGTITVNHSSQNDDFWYWYDWANDYYDEGYQYGSGGGGGSNNDNPDTTLSEEQEIKTKEYLEGLKSVLEENIKEHGDAIIKLPDGTDIRASDLLKSLGKTLDIIEAGTLTYEVATGNGDVASVAGFVAGFVGGAAAAAAGAGPIAVFAAGVAAGLLTEAAINYAVDEFNTAWDEAYQQEIQQNPNYTPGMSVINIILQMFGQPPMGSMASNPPSGGGNGGWGPGPFLPDNPDRPYAVMA